MLGLIATVATVLAAILCAFPLYWGLITTFKPEDEIVHPGVQLWPEHFTVQNYLPRAVRQTKIGVWYVNSLVTSAAVTLIVVGHGRCRGLCDLAAQLSRPTYFLGPDPGEFHGADPRPAHHPFRR